MYNKIKKFNDKKFKRKVGIKREMFEILVSVLNIAYLEKHKCGGRKAKLSVEDILLLTLTYYRDYETFFALGNNFGLDESNAYRWVRWTETVLEIAFKYLIKSITENPILNSKNEYIVDVTECGIQRPKNIEIQKEYYSGKKKKHTIKMQLIIDEKTHEIIYVCFDKGSKHDFNLFKETCESFDENSHFLADSGYQGIANIFANSLTPKKKSKYNPLSTEEQDLNKLISSIRIPVEHTNCQLKIFRILSERYRSRIKNFKICAILICCLYNFCI